VGAPGETEQEQERRAEAEALGAEDEAGAGEEPPLFLPNPPPPRSWHRLERSRGRSRLPFVFSLFLSLVRIYSFLGQAWAERAKGSLQGAASRGLRTGNLENTYAAMIYRGRTRV